MSEARVGRKRPMNMVSIASTTPHVGAATFTAMRKLCWHALQAAKKATRPMPSLVVATCSAPAEAFSWSTPMRP